MSRKGGSKGARVKRPTGKKPGGFHARTAAGKKASKASSAKRGAKSVPKKQEAKAAPGKRDAIAAPITKAAPPAAREPRPAPKAKAPVPKARPRRVPEGPHRSGFALLLGRPNVGKSTLLNRLVGEHVAIVSPRPQTTRTRILGVVNRPGTQLALVDAPGVHRAKGSFNRAMVEQAMGAVRDVDVLLYLAEAGWPSDVDPAKAAEVDPVGPFHRELLADIARAHKPVILVLTKIDLVPRPLLLPLMEAWGKAFAFCEIYPLSALTGANVDGFVDVVRKHLPEGPPLYPSDTVTDQTERGLCAEYIREQVFLQTRDEIPYSTAVSIESFDESERPLPEDEGEDAPVTLAAEPPVAEPIGEDDDEHDDDEGAAADATAEGDEAPLAAPAPMRLGPGLVRIEATIVVERSSHKAIVIGKGGDRLKKIGTISRLHIERLLGCRVWLGLHVRVVPDWTEKRGLLSELGYIQ